MALYYVNLGSLSNHMSRRPLGLAVCGEKRHKDHLHKLLSTDLHIVYMFRLLLSENAKGSSVFIEGIFDRIKKKLKLIQTERGHGLTSLYIPYFKMETLGHPGGSIS